MSYDFRGLARFVTVLSPVETKWASTRSRRRGAWFREAEGLGKNPDGIMSYCRLKWPSSVYQFRQGRMSG